MKIVWVSGNAHSLFLLFWRLIFFHTLSFFFFSLCVSGELVAPGQHRVQRPWPTGPAAAWQGMTLDNSIVSVCWLPAHPVCPAPPLCCPLHNHSSGNPQPAWFLKTTLIFADAPLCVMTCEVWVYFFNQVFVKEGTLMKVSRKSRQPRHLFLVNTPSCLEYLN